MDTITKRVLSLFNDINAIPRQSKKEEKIRQWLLDFGKTHNWQHKTDTAGNIVLRVPAKGNFQNSPPIVLQGHMDMVCVKTADSPHNFDTDPITLVYDGEWLRADKTTLGADNGIGIAYALALATDPDISHPPLELLFTVDEETGLTGATELDEDMLTGKILLNIDSEGEGYFTIGCAGGLDAHIDLEIDTIPVPENKSVLKVSVSGLTGGHSGVDINRGRGNAIKILTGFLHDLTNTLPGGHDALNIVSITGGHAHNAIPGDCGALIVLDTHYLENLAPLVTEYAEKANKTYPVENGGITLIYEKITIQGEMLTLESSNRLIDLLMALPHGVAGMTADMPELVETSSNLAVVTTDSTSVSIITSQRSSSSYKCRELTDQILAAARLAGAKGVNHGGYPSWQPNFNSNLVKEFKGLYTRLFAKEPVIEVIHAGLECGIIGSKYPGMDMISLGPTILDPHSPDERLHIPSISKVYTLLQAYLEQPGDTK